MAEENLSKPEPAPVAGGAAVWPLVIQDMQERDQAGRLKYGTPLQIGNGRRPLVDAYQEVLDLAVYMRQQIAEENDRKVRFDLLMASMRREHCGLSWDQERQIKEALWPKK
jgi:hypothetical protein